MKKIKFFAYFFILSTAFSITSCSSDNNSAPVDEGTTEGDYWPMAVNNQWVFKIDGVSQEPMKIISSQQISGNTYYKYDNLFGTSTQGSSFQGEVYTRKSGGNYYVRTSVTIPATDQTPAITVSPLEMIILKDNIGEGQTWSESLVQTTTVTGFPAITSSVQVTGKVIEKNTTITVGTATYTDVIEVQLVQTSSGITSTSTYWFAKGIGVVKAHTVVPEQEVDTTNELDSYIVN